MKQPIDPAEVVDSRNLNMNAQDYFKVYKQKMDEVQRKKNILEKDSKFQNYLAKLVDANPLNRKSNVNGIKILNEFVLDKSSITQTKKAK